MRSDNIVNVSKFGRSAFVSFILVTLAASGCALTINAEPDEPIETSAYVSRPRRSMGGRAAFNGGSIVQTVQAGAAPDWRDLAIVNGVSIGTPPVRCPESRVFQINTGNCGKYDLRVKIDGEVLTTPHSLNTQSGVEVPVIFHGETAYYCIPRPEQPHSIELTGYRPDEAGLAEVAGEWVIAPYTPSRLGALGTGGYITCR